MAEEIFVQVLTAIREKRFSKDEVKEHLGELWENYSEYFEEAGFASIPEPDWKDYENR